jgi:hypothetical protein
MPTRSDSHTSKTSSGSVQLPHKCTESSHHTHSTCVLDVDQIATMHQTDATTQDESDAEEPRGRAGHLNTSHAKRKVTSKPTNLVSLLFFHPPFRSLST